MKKGFTLAEGLITLCIIGIIAAITLPAVHRLRPDKYKIKYLQSYDALLNATRDLVSNSMEYPICSYRSYCHVYDGGQPLWYADINFASYPLMNFDTSVSKSISQEKNFRGYSKFCNLLAWQFAASDVNCSDTAIEAPNLDEKSKKWDSTSFKTNNGVTWDVRSITRWLDPLDTSRSKFRPHYGINILIDVDPTNDGKDCLYNETTCPKPDRFWFMVKEDGKIIVGDPMGKYYLKTRKTQTKKDNNPNETWEQWHTPSITDIVYKCSNDE